MHALLNDAQWLLELQDCCSTKDFSWSESSKYDEEDEGQGLWVSECATLGDTLIQMAGHWEGHNYDTQFVELACRLAPLMAKELLKRG